MLRKCACRLRNSTRRNPGVYGLPTESADARFMRRCFDLARTGVERKELPFGSVVARGAEEISAHGNGVRAAGDVTRHAEICAIVEAQKRLGPSLEGCTLYTNIEPCAFCSYAIRETRIARVVFSLASPLMGGTSRWDVLQDHGLASAMPEVFAPAPEVVAGFLADEADALLKRVAPMMWAASHSRGLFTCDDASGLSRKSARPEGLLGTMKAGAMDLLRRNLFDRFSRGTA
jgi:tRNA(adenine34) deaminase